MEVYLLNKKLEGGSCKSEVGQVVERRERIGNCESRKKRFFTMQKPENLELFELMNGHSPACEVTQAKWNGTWEEVDPRLIRLLDQVSTLTQEDMMLLVSKACSGKVLPFLKEKRSATKTPEGAELLKAKKVLELPSSRMSFGSVGFLCQEELPVRSELAKNVLCALAQGLSESDLELPLAKGERRVATVTRYGSLLKDDRKRIEFGTELDVSEIPISLERDDSANIEHEMRIYANYCGKGLLFLNHAVWGRKKDADFVSVVLYIGLEPLDVTEKTGSNKSIFGKKGGKVAELLKAREWTSGTEGRWRPPNDVGPCFVLVTDSGSDVHSISLAHVRRMLKDVFDLAIDRKRDKCLDLRNVLSVSCLQKGLTKECLNPDLRKWLMSAPEDLEQLSLAQLGLNWTRDGAELARIERFKKLVRLDLSMNGLGGKSFEEWLGKLLERLSSLRVVFVYGTLMSSVSTMPKGWTSWHERIPQHLHSRIVLTLENFSKPIEVSHTELNTK